MRWFHPLLVLLCCAAASTKAETPTPIEIPTRASHGRVLLEAKLNDSGPYHFLLDTGCAFPTLHPEVIDLLKVQPSGRIRIYGIAGEERAPTYRGIVYDFGGVSYSPRRVAAIPSERETSRRRRDGVVGFGFLREHVVQVDPTGKVTLHAPEHFEYSGKGEIIPFKLREDIPVIKASIALPDGKTLEGDFEVDTGCDSGLCLGEPFVRKHQLLEAVEGRKDAKFGVGGSVETHNGIIPALILGKIKIEKAQADFFLDGSPVDEPLAGHIGMGVLSRCRMFLDYPRNRIILEAVDPKLTLE